jgi:hypothetical protein
VGKVYIYKNFSLTYTITSGDSIGVQVALSSDGTICGTISYGTVYVYTNLSSNTPTNTFGGAASFALSADGSVLAVGDGSPTVTIYRNTGSGYSSIYTISLYGITQNFGEFVALSADGSVCAIKAVLWNPTGEGVVYIYKNGTPLYTLTSPENSPGFYPPYASTFALSGDGLTCVVSGAVYSTYFTYLYKNGNFIKKLEVPNITPPASSISLSFDGSTCAVGGYASVVTQGQVYIFKPYVYGTGYNVTYGNGVFVAVQNPGNIIYSTDGVQWNTANAPSDTWSAVTYGDGYFMAVSNNGTYPVAYSQDGVNWSTQTLQFQTTNWGSIAFGQNTFMALSSPGATTMITQFGQTF